MNQFGKLLASVSEKYQKIQPGLEKTRDVLGITGKIIWMMRKFVFAIPIVYLSFYLARMNYYGLPELVGIGLQTTGEYARMIPRETAVYGPLAVTAACLLMMFALFLLGAARSAAKNDRLQLIRATLAFLVSR
jgi:hypothetical protein